MPSILPYSILRFGDFELDCGRFDLQRKGQSLRVERKPMELLVLLASREGQLVTRREIAEQLWSSEVFVDTEHGINTAIRKVRQALKDDPDHARFVHTVSGKGYRFVAETNGQSPQAEPVTAVTPEAPQPIWGQSPRLAGGAEVPRRSPSTTAASNRLSTKIKVASAVALALAEVRRRRAEFGKF